jgi:hypothetical protein
MCRIDHRESERKPAYVSLVWSRHEVLLIRQPTHWNISVSLTQKREKTSLSASTNIFDFIKKPMKKSTRISFIMLVLSRQVSLALTRSC